MKSVLMRYATPSIIGLFLVSLVSGIALFFHVGPAALHGVHEWLSMILIVGFVLHVWRNWRPMLNYMKGKPLALAVAASIAASAVFFVPTGSATGGRPPVFALAQTLMQHSAAEVAPALGLSADELTSRLQQAGFTGSPDQPLAAIAAASGRSTMDLAGLLVQSAE
jgi:hypothetical protein